MLLSSWGYLCLDNSNLWDSTTHKHNHSSYVCKYLNKKDHWNLLQLYFYLVFFEKCFKTKLFVIDSYVNYVSGKLEKGKKRFMRENWKLTNLV